MINILSFNKKRCKELTLIQSKVTIRECWQQQLSKIAARLPPGLQLGAGPWSGALLILQREASKQYFLRQISPPSVTSVTKKNVYVLRPSRYWKYFHVM